MTDDIETENAAEELVAMTSEIVAAYTGNNQLSIADLPDLIRTVHATLSGLGGDAAAEGAEAVQAPATPAVPIDASVGKDAITCLDCGKSFKTLKRHLSAEHGLTPAAYKERWGLSKDYPLVAPSYSKKRAATAKRIGLGRKPKKS